MHAIDSHLHLWDPEHLDYAWLDGPLQARFVADDLADAGISGVSPGEAVFVQAECAQEQFLDEVRWVAAHAARTGVRGIVAGARLDRGSQTSDHLTALDGLPLIVGVRHLLQGEPDGYATSPAFLEGAALVAARGWAFDACVRARQLPNVAALAAALPDLRIVLDHLGKPEVGTTAAPVTPAARWVRDLHALAACPNTFCKLSGLPAEAGGAWDADQVTPFLDAAADAFGPDRLMWGSDWPVSALATTGSGGVVYRPQERDAWFHTVADWAQRRGHDIEAIMHGSAALAYRLP